MKKVLIAGCAQEISSFNPVECKYEIFHIIQGNEIYDYHLGKNSYIGGAIEEINKTKGTITYTEQSGEKIELSVKSGNVKLQWKPDWAMRWFALDVDYEMFGKDLIPSAELAAKICRIIGGNPPELLNYELFLDEHGQKISKSKGNGLSIEDWLRYADQYSLSFFMFQKPKTAKRLYFDVIPKMVDDYHQHLNKFIDQKEEEKFNNPVWHIHAGNPPFSNMIINFSMLLM